MFFNENNEIDQYSEGISDILEKSEHPFFVWKYLLIYTGLDILLAAVVGFVGYSGMLFANRHSTHDKGEMHGVLFCLFFGFAFGFLIGYFLFKLLKSVVVKPKPLETGLLSSFSNTSAEDNKLLIYFFSATVGVLNLAFILFVYFYFSAKYN